MNEYLNLVDEISKEVAKIILEKLETSNPGGETKVRPAVTYSFTENTPEAGYLEAVIDFISSGNSNDVSLTLDTVKKRLNIPSGVIYIYTGEDGDMSIDFFDSPKLPVGKLYDVSTDSVGNYIVV